MSAPDREQERRRLRQLRQYREALAGFTWEVEADSSGTHLMAWRKSGDLDRVATIHPCASPDEIEVLCRALETLGFALDLIDRAAARIRELAPKPQPAEKPKRDNLGFTAKSLCEQPLFRRFLETRGDGSVPDADAADARLKELLKIKSKGEIDRDPAVKAAFQQLRNDFWLWKRGDT
ncbi:hypothetical protein [Rhizobium sp. RU36D]|uniref:hypothetical protein n=1 Tax=Rhizobium sp. RU36D TaxID=1907415 RepID=UPI0009D83D63|nr:hypothetical protein [Rhizobium sp. RU36D]SMD18200.1 hypothetical protein SAMN05880593_13437 [Rhizobium sp. RU36D]